MEETLGEPLVVQRVPRIRARRAWTYRSILESNARLWMGSVLFAADALSLGIAIALASLVRDFTGTRLDSYYQEIWILLGVTLAVSFYRRRLYPAVGMHYVQELREIVSSTSFAFLIIIGATFLLKTSSVYSRLAIFVIWGLCLVMIPTARFLARRILIHWHLWGEPVVVIGDLHGDTHLADYFTVNLQLGLRPVVILKDRFFSDRLPGSGQALTMAEIRECADRLSSKTALVVIEDLNHLDALVDRYRSVFQRVILIKGRNGSYSLNSLRSLDLSDVLGLQVKNNLLSFWPQVFKRGVDVLIAIVGLAFLAPFFALVAILLRLTTTGTVYYRQKVLGRDGRQFEMLKFRTMVPNAARVLEEMLTRDPEARREWDTYQKLHNDPRITPVGKLLRKFSLDELPQLWNVLHGEMSLVGPRPMLPNQRDQYGAAFNEYVQVSPGMTGLWQVSGRNGTTFARRADLDREYIQRWSPWLDTFILVKTVKIVCWHEGAY
jgi:Undecaprenyl-phosphate galactose phosphotransferase WbaP